jgi:hypothetical protein
VAEQRPSAVEQPTVMGQHQQTGRSASSNGAAGRDGATREYLVLQSFSVLLDYSNLDPPIRANGTIKHGSASATYHNSYAGQTFYLFKLWNVVLLFLSLTTGSLSTLKVEES